MHVILQNTFTQTQGYWDKISRSFQFDANLISTVHLWKNAIVNLQMLKRKKETSQSHRLGKIISHLEILGTYLGKDIWWWFIDPIEYIIQLYFKDNLSISQIFERINGKWLNYKNPSGLAKLLTLTFWWHLKDASENKTSKLYSARTWEKTIEKTLQRKNERKAEFLSWFIKNTQVSPDQFDQSIFISFRFKYEQYIYVLENFFKIPKESFLTLQKLNMWNQSFADRWNEQFQIHSIPLEISHKDVQRIFEKFSS